MKLLLAAVNAHWIDSTIEPGDPVKAGIHAL